jgi:hypothetical protein
LEFFESRFPVIEVRISEEIVLRAFVRAASTIIGAE